MATISVYQYFTVTIDDRTVSGGSLSTAKSVSITDNEITDQTFKVAPTSAVKIWDKTENEAMGNFDFLWLETDLGVLLQLTTDVGVRDDFFVIELAGSGTAGTMGPAMILGSDDTLLADGTIDFASPGTAGTLGELWAYNESASDTARVRIVVAT